MPVSPGDPARGRTATCRPPDPLAVERVAKTYGPVTALADVDLRLHRGQVIGLVGPNGSGKSTLLGVVAGLVRPDRGVATVAGRPAGTLEAARATAFVPDEPTGFDEITVAELLVLLARLHRAAAAPVRRAQLVESFALEDMLDRRLGELSRGQRRRAALVAALQLDAPLVLVDEATAALDAGAVRAMRKALARAAAAGAGVLFATHDRAFVEEVADEVVELSDGRVVEGYRAPEARADRCREPSAA